MEKVKDLFNEIIFIGGEAHRCNVVAVLHNVETGEEKLIPGANIVTNSGDQYYAEKACGQTPTKNFAAGGMRLGIGATAPQKSDADVSNVNVNGNHAFEAGYPKTNDDDSDNTGAGADIVSWKVAYTTAQGNIVDIQELAIVDNVTTPTAALCHALFAAKFTKTSNDTLKVFVNHQFNGV